MNPAMKCFRFFGFERGSALLTSLFVLIVLTLLAIMVMNMSLMQERMAGNVRESNQAFQAAEATMREIEARLLQVAAGGTGGLGVIPLWSNVAAANPSDCTLGDTFGANWGAAPWRTAPTTGNDYLVYALGETMDVGGIPRGNPCRPMRGASTSSTTTGLGNQYLIVTRARGPTDIGEVILQAIYWPVF